MSSASAIGLLPLRLGSARIGLRKRIVAAIAIELLYMWLSRVVYDAGLSYADLELVRTPLRLIAAAIHWLLMADVIFGERPRGQPVRKVALCSALLVLFSVPLLVEDYDNFTEDAWIIAVASFPVGIHEELFFRGIVQTLLVKRLGAARGIGIVVVLFTLFHIGVTDPDVWNFAATAFAGAMLSLLYWRTGSLAGVVMVHAIHDALYAVTWTSVVSEQVGVILLFAGAYLLLPRGQSEPSPSAPA